ncbi:hypothetical protein NL676_028591 [Syzygium grande]|nr:hypothetical protein NL676_028591 [Syzygium grande]
MPIRYLAAWNAMLHGYLENAREDNAVKLFEQMPSPNVISQTSVIGRLDQNVDGNVVICTALLTGHGLNGRHEDGLKVFGDMMRTSVLPNQSSFVRDLYSCCGLESLDRGEEVHASGVQLKLGSNVFVGNSLVVMYNKCGLVDDAVAVFKRLRVKNILTWNAIVSRCAQHG